jgi:plastocyanin
LFNSYMPKKTHERRHHHKHDASQSGFIAESASKKELIGDNLTKSMNRKEKLIMGLLVGGIVTFLLLSIIVLFGKGNEELQNTGTPANTISGTPAVKVLTTPYPTIPPMTDFLMQVNEDRFYPANVSIKRGFHVTILNIGRSATTITPTQQGNPAIDFGTIEPGEEKAVLFETPGVYRYTRTGHSDQILTISVQ